MLIIIRLKVGELSVDIFFLKIILELKAIFFTFFLLTLWKRLHSIAKC